MHPNDPSNDSAPVERIVAELIEGDELLDVIGSLPAQEYALYEVCLLRALRNSPEVFGEAWPMLEAALTVRAEVELRKRDADGERDRWEAAA